MVNALDWRFVAAWLATLTLIWTTYAFAHRAIVESMERDLQERIETHTLLFEDQASRALDGVVSRMEAVAELSAGQELSERQKFSQRLQDLILDDTVVRSLSLIDAQGYIVVSSNLSSVGQRVAKSVLESIGPPPFQARKGVRFSSSLVQRDLTEPPREHLIEGASQSIWLGQIDARNTDLTAHRWIVAINSGFFRNFWDTAIRTNDVQVGLFSYAGQPLVTLGQGPGLTVGLAEAIENSLRIREKGEVNAKAFNDWIIRYRASIRHAVAFVMLVDRTVQLQKQVDRTSVLRMSALAGSLLATAVIWLFYRSFRRYHRFAWANKILRQHAHTDALTGLANRRAFDELVPQELTRSGSLGLPFSLLILDLDHFKKINDRFGHPAGDAVLQEVGRRWQGVIRSDDLIARIGGDEFCVVLPATGVQQARAVALKLLENTRRKAVAAPSVAPLLKINVSIGLVAFDACPDDLDVATLLRAADAALYRAKENRRNQIAAAVFPRKQGGSLSFIEFGQVKTVEASEDDTQWVYADLNQTNDEKSAAEGRKQEASLIAEGAPREPIS